MELRRLEEGEVAKAIGDEPAVADLQTLGNVGVMAGDTVGPRIGQGAESLDDVRRREWDIFEAGVPDRDDEIAPLLGLLDQPGEPLDLPAADAGASFPLFCGRREVLAFAEIDDRDARAFYLERQGGDGFFKAESRPGRPDAVSAKGRRASPGSLSGHNRNVIVAPARDLKRDGGQARDMSGKSLEDGAAFPDGLIGVCEGAFAIDDPDVESPEGREDDSIDGLRIPQK